MNLLVRVPPSLPPTYLTQPWNSRPTTFPPPHHPNQQLFLACSDFLLSSTLKLPTTNLPLPTHPHNQQLFLACFRLTYPPLPTSCTKVRDELPSYYHGLKRWGLELRLDESRPTKYSDLIAQTVDREIISIDPENEIILEIFHLTFIHLK